MTQSSQVLVIRIKRYVKLTTSPALISNVPSPCKISRVCKVRVFNHENYFHKMQQRNIPVFVLTFCTSTVVRSIEHETGKRNCVYYKFGT